MTFMNPSQFDKTSKSSMFKCEKCDFAASKQDIIENHKELIHNWCPVCFSNFNNQKNLKKHIKNAHNDNEA